MSHRSERWFTRTLARKHRDRSLKANRRPVLESLEDRVPWLRPVPCSLAVALGCAAAPWQMA